METLNWLKQLALLPGVSGFESAVKKVLSDKLSDICDEDYDGIGSVIFTLKEQHTGPKVMVAAHMDEVGFMVKNITPEGYLKFTCIGGWWDQVLLGQRVTVLTKSGEVPGLIGSKPPHILPPDERKKPVDRKDMYIDVGAKDKGEAEEVFGISLGDAIVPAGEFVVMKNPDYLMAKAWDNRIGCAMMAEAMRRMAKIEHTARIYGVGTVQEEVGLRGAQTSASKIMPDIGLVVDTCVAGDVPGVSDDLAPGKLGGGIGITIYDASMIPSTALRDYAIAIAKKHDIPYQLVFTEGGGTDGGRIHLAHSGVPTLVLSIATRYLHSHYSIIHRKDYEAGVALLCAILTDLNDDIVKEIRQA